MAWTTPGTAVAGEVLTAAFWNEQVRDNQNYLYKPPMCFIYRTSADTSNNATWLRPTFDGELYDTDAMHDTSTNTERITFKTEGVYLVKASCYFDNASTSGIRILSLQKNATNVDPGAAGGGINIAAFGISGQANLRAEVVGIHRFAVNDYMTMHVYQNHGSAMVIGAVVTQTGGFTTGPTSSTSGLFMSATWLGNPA